MTAIRQTLQKDLFSKHDEHLLSAINVSKKKKKKVYFLCLCITTGMPVSCKVHLVKPVSDKPNSGFVKTTTWRLRDIRLVDAIHPKKVQPEFHLHLDDKTYIWFATVPEEKEVFIRQLWKASARYLVNQKPEFVNMAIPVEHLEMLASSSGVAAGGRRQSKAALTLADTDSSSSAAAAAAIISADDYTQITAAEQADFRRLLEQCHLTIGDAEKFQASLLSQLRTLDTDNMHSIMGSEQAVKALMAVIDAALEQADIIDDRLTNIDNCLADVRESVELMEEKDSVAHVEQNNRQRLIKELEQFMKCVDLPAEHAAALTAAHLNDGASITACTRAAHALHAALSVAPSSSQRAAAVDTPPLERMDVYGEQMTKLNALADSFADQLLAHLTTFFQNMSEQTDEVGEWHRLSLPKHSQIHRPLLPFAELTLWLKQIRPAGYEQLCKRYVSYAGAIYKRDMNTFFAHVLAELRLIADGGGGRKASSTLTRPIDMSRSLGDTSLLQQVDDASFAEAADRCSRLCDTLLSEVDPVVVSEQKFVVRFLHISQELLPVDKSDAANSAQNAERKAERQYNEHIKTIMRSLFVDLDDHLSKFIATANEAEPSWIMRLLVVLSHKALAITDSGASYFGVVLGSAVIRAKRQFDLYMDSCKTVLSEYKSSKRTRVGIIDAARQFKVLATNGERSFAGASVRRSDIDRWYPQLLLSVRMCIERASNDANSKAPASVVRFENYHFLHSTLSELKIACLEVERREVKQSYQSALEAYVREYMGRPLDKLATFFDNIQQLIDKGVAPQEIGYHQQFNKTDLKKLIAHYPGREVKKGLEQLYKRIVDKHLTDGQASPLLQVVWRNMQDEFLRQLKNYSSLIEQCYPGQKIELEFSIQDVLTYFSDIAMQH